MKLNTDGLVLRAQNIGENDRLIYVLTRTQGVVHAFVRGARKVSGRMLSSTQPFAYSRFVFFKSKDKLVVDEAETVKIFFKFGEDVQKIALAYYFAELALALSPVGDNAESFLRLALNSLNFLTEEKRNCFLLKATFELRILALAGYMPNLLGCNECGAYESGRMFFLPKDGLLLCGACSRQPQGTEIKPGVLTAMRHVIYSDFEKLFSFSLSDEGSREFSSVTERFLLLQTDRKFSSLDFYKSLE